MKMISNLKIIDEFTYESILYGQYECIFNEEEYFFTRDGDEFELLTHYEAKNGFKKVINKDVINELLQAIECERNKQNAQLEEDY